MGMEGERLVLSVADVARLLGLSTNKTYDLIAENLLPHIRLGGPRSKIIIPRDALDQWLANRAQPTRVPVA